jgi:hypothetical protein
MLWLIRAKRFFFAGSSVALVLLIPVAALAVGVLGKVEGPSERHFGKIVLVIPQGWMITVAIYAGFGAFVFALIETYGKYRHATYDPTWTLQYQKMWDEVKPARVIAA